MARLENHVRVGASDPEAAYSRHPFAAVGPVDGRHGNVEGLPVGTELRVRCLKFRGRRQEAVIDRQSGTDKPDKSGCGTEMPDLALDCREGDLSRLGALQGLPKRPYLYRIPESGTGSVRLDIADIPSGPAAASQCVPDDIALTGR